MKAKLISAGAQDKRNDLEVKESGSHIIVRAWSIAKSLPPVELAPQSYLKTTGIAIALGSMLESIGRLDQAYDVYSDALSHLQEAGSKTPLSIDEQMRGVTLSCKLAEMANILARGSTEEEKWLVWAVEVILKNVMVSDPARIRRGEEGDAGPQVKPSEESESLGLPDWVSGTDLAAPFEALGTLYARAGRYDYALPLFLQAVSFLIPLPPQTSPAADRCRGAQTMSTISELIMRANPSNEGIAQAESWSRKALDITTDTKKKLEQESRKWFSGVSGTDPVCEVALAVSLFNIGVLREMAEDKKEAKRFLRASLKQSQLIGLEEGASATKEALQRVEHNA
ncbi:hypothetical protein AX15_001416 [Amanita polypyramis BW_CC]|nr:hypothetical protein AX15_001416 [Amanita polypyramis BW_CC]